MKVNAVWQNKLSFTGTSPNGFSVPMDGSVEHGGDNTGFRPTELLLIGLAGCTGMDVISILEKKRQKVTHFEVLVSGERAGEHPRSFTDILVEYAVTGVDIDPAAVERAVELSETKYCSVAATINQTVRMAHKISITQIQGVA